MLREELAATARLFQIFTVGWDTSLIKGMTSPIAQRTGIGFAHGLVGDTGRLSIVRGEQPGTEFVALSKGQGEALPAPDYEMLASLECVGVPTIKNMVLGDRVLRHRDESVSLGYATLLARRLRQVLDERKPDLVLGSFDSLHAALSLAVAKSLNIPWVAMAFTAIPNNLTGFCRAPTPDTLVPIGRRSDAGLLQLARELMDNVRMKRQKVLAYQPPVSLLQKAQQFLGYGSSVAKRLLRPETLGYDEFCFPSTGERLHDVLRRSVNKFRLPTHRMLLTPSEGGFAFFPLHMSPESSIDTWAPFHQNQLAFATMLAQALPANLELVVKLHFSDPDNYSRSQLQRLMSMPRVRIAHPDARSHAFLERARLVIGIQGTSCLEAALLGKPVLIFGDSPYQHFPRTERGRRADELYGQMLRMLDRPPATDDEIAGAFAAYMARYMPGRVNDWNQPIEPEGLDQLAECFRALRTYLDDPAVRANWYRTAPFAPSGGESR